MSTFEAQSNELSGSKETWRIYWALAEFI